ncbi:hypothetical protein [Enterocloster citroniae]|jgi:hypothetical protein|uniref:hypothetical protein n=1 Tax=Enterocloster citroniae TaxID=358743 RepID=UPI00349E6BBD
MKKTIFALALAVSMLTACGGKAEATSDLSGTWTSEKSGDSYQEAVITDNYIEINWMSKDTKSLYWAGSYIAPESAVTEYSWTSENDTEKTGSALLASGDDTKEFTYKDGVISYEASAMGTTKTMKLTKQK